MGNTGTMKRMGRAGRVNVTRKDGSNRECNQLIAAALTSGCAQENKKLRQNVLDGADFVRDVLDNYLTFIEDAKEMERLAEGTSCKTIY